MSGKPVLVVILSGKRKSGKDFVAELIEKRYRNGLAVIHISKPIKQKYAELHGAAFDELMKASEYKEQFRLDMVKWSEKEKLDRNDQAYFLKLAIELEKAQERKVWLVADARRPADIGYFDSPQFDSVEIIKVRIQATDETRKSRGWMFTKNIDDATTECGLDNFTDWTHVIDNNGTCDELVERLNVIFDKIDQALT
ncbi:phosphomevalonate kinase-like [Tetranychus urticae]|uniref:Phosphomevalonate kinase n=1 Tax=Tetranychus urticae TaxID=32264 RepID=T1K222_TETUR|nr:phosphomevalonate kinase-like [Tetranychus urticae]XP_015782096.1 phosphomevalonate kinase-like [Tetranychus urticae]XP_015782097.1 phosphomevalonate kinase-like [Tetranychus urticae]